MSCTIFAYNLNLDMSVKSKFIKGKIPDLIFLLI